MKDIPRFLRATTLIAHIGGRTFHLMIQPRGAPPPGNYDIHPPVQDPVYGMLALMLPAAGPAAPHGEKDWKYWTYQPAMHANAPAALSPYQPVKLGSPAYAKMVSPAAGLSRPESPSQGPQVFVISDRPIPGRNAVVISSGFADLMDALRASGGATIQVT